MTHPTDPHARQFALLGQRRFGPFFWTQFLGAANDNLFKFAFTVLVTYQVQVAWLPPAMAGLAIGALFILPFLLFSATAGQFADKLPKHTLIRAVKTLEIATSFQGKSVRNEQFLTALTLFTENDVFKLTPPAHVSVYAVGTTTLEFP